MVSEFILLVLGAYFLGAISPAYLIARWRRGIDIRQYGSGNVGASNVLAVVSKRWTIPVSVFDLTKGMVLVGVARVLGLGATQQVAIGLAAIIGHNWSVFLRFSGGRGIFTSLGVVLILSPQLGLIVLAISALFLPFRQLSLGVFVASISLPILSWFPSRALGIEERLPILSGSLAILLILVFRRLTARQNSSTASVSRGELIINRLLFDRDIRDRKAWISRTLTKLNSRKQSHEQETETPPSQPTSNKSEEG